VRVDRVSEVVASVDGICPRRPRGHTELRSRGGPLGALERFLARSALRRIYAEELALLAALAERDAPASSGALKS
jgi:hypothetical protein